jgi:hypothetical protein
MVAHTAHPEFVGGSWSTRFKQPVDGKKLVPRKPMPKIAAGVEAAGSAVAARRWWVRDEEGGCGGDG